MKVNTQAVIKASIILITLLFVLYMIYRTMTFKIIINLCFWSHNIEEYNCVTTTERGWGQSCKGAEFLNAIEVKRI